MSKEIIHTILVVYVMGSWLLFETYIKSKNNDVSKGYKWEWAFKIIAFIMAIFTVAIFMYSTLCLASIIENRMTPNQNIRTKSEIMTDVLIYNPDMKNVKEVYLCPEEINSYIKEYEKFPEYLKYAIDNETHAIFEFSEIMDDGYYRYIRKE